MSVENIEDIKGTGKFISKKDFDKLYPIKPKKGDILFTRIGDIGTPAIVNTNDDLAFYVSLALLRIVVKNVNVQYLYYYIQSPYFKKELHKKTIHNAFPVKINKNEIGKCQIILKKYYEQTYISDFLSLIDKKISLFNKKIETLKKYKKGIQQFSFKATNNEVYTKLNSLVSFMAKSKLNAGDSIENGIYPFYLSGEKVGTVNEFMYKGCYIIANDGGEAGFRLSNGSFAYSNHCICFRSYNERTTRNLYEYLDSQKEKITYVGFLGSGLKNIDRTYLKSLKIPLAVENKKLSVLFLSLNKKICYSENKLLLLKTTKQFLLANMFI